MNKKTRENAVNVHVPEWILNCVAELCETLHQEEYVVYNKLRKASFELLPTLVISNDIPFVALSFDVKYRDPHGSIENILSNIAKDAILLNRSFEQHFSILLFALMLQEIQGFLS